MKRQDKSDTPPPPGERDRTFDPSEIEATRAREQGVGVGQKELDRQRDPTRHDNARP
jgi:hypothetical protein